MTDLERDASDLVRDILDAAAQALGGKDLDLWLAVNVDQRPFKDRIVALVKEDTAEQIVRDLHRAVRHSCGVHDHDRMSPLDTRPFIARIDALLAGTAHEVEQAVAVRISNEERRRMEFRRSANL